MDPTLKLTNATTRIGSESGKPNMTIYFRADDIYTNGLLYKKGSIREISTSSLPLNWIDFQATRISQEKAMLQWEVANEKNIKAYDVEKRLSEDQQFTPIGTVKAYNTDKVNYNFIDANSDHGFCYYRIKEIDYDGQVSYSIVKGLSNDALSDMNLKIQLLPVPAEDDLMVKIWSPQEDLIEVNVVDILGRIFIKENKNISEGYTSFLLDVRMLSEGSYFLQTRTMDGQQTIKNFLVR